MYIRPELQVAFDRAVAEVMDLTIAADSPAARELYALYHQATLGDISGQRPGHGEFAARARWDAWHALQGMPIPLAMLDYVELVESLRKSQPVEPPHLPHITGPTASGRAPP
jgi:acyl-CoA-binding protein